jgi:hypothetical protein
MKKVILFFFIFIMSFSFIFGFEILDNGGNSKSYFSLNDHQVSLKSLQNESPLTIMVLEDNSTLMSYEFIPCGVEYCYDFSLVDYMTSVNLVLNSTEFVVSAAGTSKSIFFDSVNPTFSLQNSIIDSQNKLLKLYFTFSDDFNVDFVEVFEVKSGSVQSFGQLSSNSYDFALSYQGNITLRFKVTDGAGNFDTFNFDFEILDLFAPVISDVVVIKNDNVFNLKFSATDSNLQKYDIAQNDLKLTGVLSGESSSENINLPFSSGSIVLTLFDSLGNSKSESISLGSSFDVDVKNKFSNEDVFILDSDASSCIMISVDSKIYTENFLEDDEEFSVDLDLNSQGNYELTFSCENSNYKETFVRDFYYDTKNPSDVVLSFNATSSGFVKLSWTESVDLISDVNYELFRDGKKIYYGSRESFIDEDVLFSDFYEYYLEISDEARNSIESNLVSGSPNKIFVELSSSISGDIEVSIPEYSFDVVSESGAETIVSVKNLGDEFFSRSLSSSDGHISLTLVPGVNEIIVNSVDEFSNKNFLRYFITYNKPIPLVKKVDSIIVSAPEKPTIVDISGSAIRNEIQDPENTSVSETGVGSSFSGAWFVLLFFILLMFVYTLVFNKSKLPGYLNIIISKNVNRDSKKNLSNDGSDIRGHKRHMDAVLHKHIGRVKLERIQKHKKKIIVERKAKVDSMKPKRELSKIEKLKHGDLNNRNKFDFNISHKISSDIYKMKPEYVESEPKNEEVFKLETPIKDEGMELKLKKKLSLFGFFRNHKVELTQEELENDKFLGYIGKQRNSQSWDKTDLYKQSHYDKIATKKLDALKLIEEQRRMELQTKQLEIDKQTKKLAKKAKVESEKQEFKNNRKIARATMDDYLSKKSKMRSFWFAEKVVNTDIKSRDK